MIRSMRRPRSEDEDSFFVHYKILGILVLKNCKTEVISLEFHREVKSLSVSFTSMKTTQVDVTVFYLIKSFLLDCPGCWISTNG